MNRYPAVVIGGPPHSGKSVLIYSLSQALRKHQIDHYILRACPDGEGDWANEADQVLVRTLRIKGEWSPQWVESMCRDIEQRHLPLLVDIGGKPTLEQEQMLDCCTHSILLTKDSDSYIEWQQRLARHGLLPVAELTSAVEGESDLTASSPLVEGMITNLHRSTTASGVVFAALVDRLATLFAYDRIELRRNHLALAPVELAVDLDRLALTLGFTKAGHEVTWQPEHLPRLLDYLPAGAPLALYGRGANWVQAAAARLAYPAAYYSFDIRLGWVAAMALRVTASESDAPLQFEQSQTATYTHLIGRLASPYIDYRELAQFTAPPLPLDRGVVLSGRLPYWLYTSLIFTYQAAPWLAVYQPQLNGAVIVYSRDDSHVVGACLPIG